MYLPTTRLYPYQPPPPSPVLSLAEKLVPGDLSSCQTHDESPPRGMIKFGKPEDALSVGKSRT